MAKLRDHTFLGTTQSLCPECLALVPAKIITKGQRVYFRKRCPTHGVREDFICSDVALYDQMQYSLPGKVPPEYGVEPDKGCPYDCGLCTEHEQHTCIGLVEVTSSCNLRCPMCYASSGPGRQSPELRRMCPLDRPPRRGRGTCRGLAALRRRADHPPRFPPAARATRSRSRSTS